MEFGHIYIALVGSIKKSLGFFRLKLLLNWNRFFYALMDIGWLKVHEWASRVFDLLSFTLIQLVIASHVCDGVYSFAATPSIHAIYLQWLFTPKGTENASPINEVKHFEISPHMPHLLLLYADFEVCEGKKSCAIKREENRNTRSRANDVEILFAHWCQCGQPNKNTHKYTT